MVGTAAMSVEQSQSPDSFSIVPRHVPHVFKSVDPPYSIEDCRSWLAVPFPAAKAAVPNSLVVRPEFRSDGQSFYGAYGVAIELESSDRLMITFLHIMGDLAKSAGIDCALNNPAYTGE